MAGSAGHLRRKTIERALSQVPDHPDPKPELEQYTTPAGIATDVLFEAFHLGDIGGRFVLDFGCGTGILATGAGLMGAMPVYGFDIDEQAIQVATHAAAQAGVSQAEFIAMDVAEMAAYEGDTILCNPPFGAQKKHADRPFLEAAGQAGKVCWTFHHAPSRDWAVSYIEEELGGQVTHMLDFRFPLKAQFPFHTKPSQDIEVVVVRWETEKTTG